MRFHLLTPVKSLQKHVSSIQEKQNTDKLCLKLEELSKRIEEQESGYNDVVLRMIETNVYMMLATIQTTDYNLFNQLTIYFKSLLLIHYRKIVSIPLIKLEKFLDAICMVLPNILF